MMEKEKLKRTHYCGELKVDQIKQEVVLMGWVQRRRDLGGVIFVDLRDRSGICQIVLDARNLSENEFLISESLRNEFVIAVSGEVEKRSDDTINPNTPTGEIDIRVKKIKIFSEAKNAPFRVGESLGIKEDLRLKYRYLDLRTPEMLNNLKLRQSVTQVVRNFLIAENCLEVETPILTKSTPEGARDFLVPSRMNKGSFYALPQSPQIYKQLLMVGGIDRYFQIARCFRDEDLRADRQLEFTQVDMEFSFVDEEDVIDILERLFKSIFENVMKRDIQVPFERITYADAMDQYGFDKPDLRFKMPIVDLTAIMATCDFTVFKKVVKQGGVVKALNVKGGNAFTRTQIEYLTTRAVEHGGNGMAWIALDADGNLQSVLTKYFSKEQMDSILLQTSAEPGDMIIFCAEPLDKARYILGSLRLDIGDMLDLRKKDDFAFVVVTDFPLLEYDEEQKRYVAMHHPFTMPKDEDAKYFESEPQKMRAKAYDIVLNGVELGSGSIRIFDRDLQALMFKTLGFTAEQVDSRFGFMLGAFDYGVPPHGGFAFGLDRLVMMLVGASSIREVIAFPKMRDGSCAMTDSPSGVDEKQLEELSLYLNQAVIIEKNKEVVDHTVIDYVSDLARIALSEKEKDAFARDLMEVIAFADQLSEIDVSSVEPLHHVMGSNNVFRKDEISASLDVELLLRNAPNKVEKYFFVPRTVE